MRARAGEGTPLAAEYRSSPIGHQAGWTPGDSAAFRFTALLVRDTIRERTSDGRKVRSVPRDHVQYVRGSRAALSLVQVIPEEQYRHAKGAPPGSVGSSASA
jgi:hypothetical protein